MKGMLWKSIPILVLFAILSASLAIGADFSAQLTPTTINASLVQELNLTITNLDPVQNITKINITLPQDFEYQSISDSGNFTFDEPANKIIGDVLIAANTSEVFFIQVIPRAIGTFNFNVSAQDTANVITTNQTNSITVNDVLAPKYSNIRASPTSPVVYEEGRVYFFNITWSEDIQLDEVIFNLNGTNYTHPQVKNVSSVFYINFTGLQAGNYTYYWYANDTSSNSNTTQLLNYTIQKANNPITVLMEGVRNGNITTTNGTEIDISVSTIGKIEIYIDSTLAKVVDCPSNCSTNHSFIGYSTNLYNVTIHAGGNVNYTSNVSTYFAMVVPSYNYSEDIPSTYTGSSTTFSINFSSAPNFKPRLELNFSGSTNYYNMTNSTQTSYYHKIIFPACTLYWRIIGEYENHEFNLTPLSSATISKATPEIELTASPAWIVYEGNQTIIICSSDDVSVNLYRNGKSASSPDVQTLGVGNYTYKCNTTGNENYTSRSIEKVLWVLEKVEVELIANFIFEKVEDLIAIVQNSTNSTKVEIKNVGDVDQNVSLEVINIDPGWFSIEPKYSTVSPGSVKTFTVTFSIGFPEFKDYAGKFKASSPNKTIEKEFTLRVLPSEENKTAMDEKIQELELNLSELEEKLEKYREKFNVTEVEEMLESAREKLNETKAYFEEESYFEAKQAMSELENKLMEIDSKLKELELRTPIGAAKGFWKKYWMYIVVGIVVVVFAAILIYMFLPPREEKVTKRKVEVGGEFKKLMEKWRKRSGVEGAG